MGISLAIEPFFPRRNFNLIKGNEKLSGHFLEEN